MILTKWRNPFLIVISVAFFVCALASGFFNNPVMNTIFTNLVVTYFGIMGIKATILFWGGLRDKIAHNRMHEKETNYYPFISIIVPAFNEDVLIEKSLNSLKVLKYPNYEIIVVDDGSSDDTAQIAENVALFSEVPVQVVTKPNGGKSSALNYGITFASGELILCVDADSRLAEDTLLMGVRYFEDSNVGAVAGYVEIANQNHLLTRFQQLEYMIGLNYVRRAYSSFGIIPIIPGPIGLFRRRAMLDLGGYDRDREIFAEDAELTMRLVARGWDIKGEELMVSYTEAPEDLLELLKQRYRWNRGTFQAFSKTISFLFQSADIKRNLLGLLQLLDHTFFVILDFGILLAFMSRFIFQGDVTLFAIWVLFVFILELLVVFIAATKYKNWVKWSGLMILSKFSYHQIMGVWKIMSLFDEWGRARMSWGKLKRTGTL